MIDIIHDYINKINTPLWEYLIILLLGTGLFFTLATGLVQIRLFGRSVREILNGNQKGEKGDEHITAFQAFATGLASRVGIGNIAGVAIAIASGGPGAVFWMWVTALIGMSSAFAESSLAQLFKVRDPATGRFRGGPAYYITQGMGQKWLGSLFALSLIFCFGLVYEAVQSNSIMAAVEVAWGWSRKELVGVGLVILTAPIIIGGIRRVARVAEMLVPLMALVYLAMTLFIMVVNVAEIPRIFGLIIRSAFEWQAVGGGILGSVISAAMMNGIRRGLYSNEAGQGSAPNAAAAADVKHPVSQGMIQMLGVFIDTMVVCSCTAFILLLSDVHTAQSTLTGVQLTQAALVQHVGAWGADFLAVILFVFAFTTIIGNYAYAESNVQYLNQNPVILTLFRMAALGMVYFGTIATVPVAWDMADLAMGIMALINLVAILALSKYVFALLKDYQGQLAKSQEPVFRLVDHPEMQDKIRNGIW